MSDWIPLTDQKPAGDGERLVLVWHTYLGCWTDRARKHGSNRFYTHWMEAPTNGWIRTDDRTPTQDDADGQNCVLFANDDLTIMRVAGWFQTEIHPDYTMWMKTPAGPTK